MSNFQLPRTISRRVAVIVAALAFVAGALMTPTVSAQNAEAVELAGIRQSLNQILGLLQEYLQQTQKRDSASMLSDRLTAGERRLTSLEQDLKDFMAQRQKAETRITELRNQMSSTEQMAKMDRTGQVMAQVQPTLAKNLEEIDQLNLQVSQLSQRITGLESEVTERRASIQTIEQALDRQLGLR